MVAKQRVWGQAEGMVVKQRAHLRGGEKQYLGGQYCGRTGCLLLNLLPHCHPPPPSRPPASATKPNSVAYSCLASGKVPHADVHGILTHSPRPLTTHPIVGMRYRCECSCNSPISKNRRGGVYVYDGYGSRPRPVVFRKAIRRPTVIPRLRVPLRPHLDGRFDLRLDQQLGATMGPVHIPPQIQGSLAPHGFAEDHQSRTGIWLRRP